MYYEDLKLISTSKMKSKYIQCINILNSIMNGTYQYKNINDTRLLVKLLMNQIEIDDNKTNMPSYVEQILNKYCSKLTKIVFLWNAVFGRNGSQNTHLKHTLFTEEIDFLFFDLQRLLMIFPNIEKIEFSKHSVNEYEQFALSNKNTTMIIDYIQNSKITTDNNKLTHIIIHHNIKLEYIIIW